MSPTEIAEAEEDCTGYLLQHRAWRKVRWTLEGKGERRRERKREKERERKRDVKKVKLSTRLQMSERARKKRMSKIFLPGDKITLKGVYCTRDQRSFFRLCPAFSQFFKWLPRSPAEVFKVWQLCLFFVLISTLNFAQAVHQGATCRFCCSMSSWCVTMKSLPRNTKILFHRVIHGLGVPYVTLI